MRWSGLLIALFAFLAGCTGRPDGIEPVSPFDINRYKGVWYEIMRLDHSFERGLTNVTATYDLRDDGTVGVLTRKNALLIFMSVELQLNAVNLALVAMSRYVGIEGQLFVFFVMTVAAAEAAVGLAIIISIFRHYETVNVDNFNLLKW